MLLLAVEGNWRGRRNGAPPGVSACVKARASSCELSPELGDSWGQRRRGLRRYTHGARTPKWDVAGPRSEPTDEQADRLAEFECCARVAGFRGKCAAATSDDRSGGRQGRRKIPEHVLRRPGQGTSVRSVGSEGRRRSSGGPDAAQRRPGPRGLRRQGGGADRR